MFEDNASVDPHASAAPELDRDPVEELAEEFLDRRRRGETVSIDQYAEAHPESAERIRELFPALLLMEELKPPPSSSRAGVRPVLCREGEALSRLGDFRILREVGRGGMGVVYEAEQESLGRRVALKVLPPAYTASPSRLRRFLREAQAAARLHHTNIVPVFGVGQQDGIHYYVMQFIPGQGLDQVIQALRNASVPETTVSGPERPDGEGETPALPGSADALSASEAARMLRSGLSGPIVAAPLSGLPGQDPRPPSSSGAEPPAGQRFWQSVARIGIQVAEALEYAHRQGTLHRDIKPGNLLLDRDGIVWIADFGLAKLADLDDLTHSGDMVGTLRYMAPEQFEGQADARSDVYSLGLTLYELVTLRPAFGDEDRRRLLHGIARAEPPRPRKINPAIPRDLETIILKAISPHPEHRYQTAAQLAADLRCFLEDRPIRARRASTASRAWRWCRRNRAVAILTGTAIALLMTIAVVSYAGWRQTEAAFERESVARQDAEAEQAKTKAEHERAEANLRLAIKAFEDIFGRIAPDTAAPLPEESEDEPWPEPAAMAAVTGKDAALLEAMLKFYDQFAAQNQSDLKLQRETARAYRRVGDIQRRLGQSEKAEAAYGRALATYEAIAQSPAPGTDPHTSIAAIHNELGVLYRTTGRFPDAAKLHQEALKILEEEPAATKALAESRFELARTYALLSTSIPGPPPPGKQPGSRPGPRPRQGGSWPGPENNRRALEILGELIKESPENPRYRLAMARAQRDRSMFPAFAPNKDEADAARKEAIGILEQLIAESPQNPEYCDELAETYCPRYFRRREEKPPEHFEEDLARAVNIRTDLVARYPAVPSYKASLAWSYVRSAEAVRTKDPAAAVAQLAKAVELQRGLVLEFPKIHFYHFSLAGSLHQLADVELERKDPAKARAALEEAVAVWEKVRESVPDPRFVRRPLAREYGYLAKVLREQGETALAEQMAVKGRELSAQRPPLRRDVEAQPKATEDK